MAKTAAQIEKKIRETEKRKKTEKAILKMAALLPDDDLEQGQAPSKAGAKTTKDKT